MVNIAPEVECSKGIGKLYWSYAKAMSVATLIYKIINGTLNKSASVVEDNQIYLFNQDDRYRWQWGHNYVFIISTKGRNPGSIDVESRTMTTVY